MTEITQTEPASETPAAEAVASAPQPEAATVAAQAGGEAAELSANARRAGEILQIGMGWSSGAGLLPVPGLDLVAMLGVQLRMVHAIAGVYQVPFKREVARPLLLALISSGGAYTLASPAASLLKLVPVVGLLASAVAAPSLAVASCYATGKVFIQHFESGGTFLDLDPAKARKYYAEHFKWAQRNKPPAETGPTAASAA